MGQRARPATDVDVPEALKIAWVQPDLEELGAAGLETLELDAPSRMVEAYVNHLNSQGGINGNCFELIKYQWTLRNAQEDIERICTELPQHEPLALLTFRFDRNLLRCLTLDAGILTMSFYASIHDSALAQAPTEDGQAGAYWIIVNSALTQVPENLYLDQHATREIFTNTLDVALRTGQLTTNNKIGLLFPPVDDASSQDGSAATASGAFVGLFLKQIAQERGLDIAYEATVPAEFQSTEVQIAERRARILRSDLSETEAQAAHREFRSLSVDEADLLVRMEDYWASTVDDFRIAGVDTVISAADWTNLRRMMRASDGANWTPKWIINDLQPVPLLLSGTPERQGHNLLQVSSARAAGDLIPTLDQECITMRNTATDAPSVLAPCPHGCMESRDFDL